MKTVELVSISWTRRGAALLGALAMALLATAPAFANTYHAHDAASLQAAVASADASGSADTIELAAGVYLPTETLSFSGQVAIVGPSSGSGAELTGSAVEPAPAGLLDVEAHARLSLVNVQLTGGGGMAAPAIDDLGALDLESSTVAGNLGTGLLVESGATATVTDSTLSEGLGFGVVNDGDASFNNATIALNKDGGVENKGTLSLTNTIVADNRGAGDCKGRATATDRSLDSDGSCGVGGLSATNPLLGALTDNGGPTSTQALGAGSPAIGGADASRCPADDQRHFARPPGRCDIGAYQTGATQAGPGSGTGQGSGGGLSTGSKLSLIGVSGHGTLRGARRSPIVFNVRALLGHRGATFRYTDARRHLRLTSLTLRSISIDAHDGVATLRGRAVELASRHRVTVTVVLVSHGVHHNLRIHLSSGYFKSGSLLKGSISFLQHRST